MANHRKTSKFRSKTQIKNYSLTSRSKTPEIKSQQQVTIAASILQAFDSICHSPRKNKTIYIKSSSGLRKKFTPPKKQPSNHKIIN
jgi:hypothetical protein